MIGMIGNKTSEESSAGWKKHKRSTIRLFFSLSIITILFVLLVFSKGQPTLIVNTLFCSSFPFPYSIVSLSCSSKRFILILHFSSIALFVTPYQLNCRPDPWPVLSFIFVVRLLSFAASSSLSYVHCLLAVFIDHFLHPLVPCLSISSFDF